MFLIYALHFRDLDEKNNHYAGEKLSKNLEVFLTGAPNTEK